MDADVGRFDGGEDLSHGNLQSASESHEDVGAGIRLGQLDTANVLVVQACELGQTFLRQLSLEAQPA